MAHVEVILTENIDQLGRAGDVVRVAAGYARNYLIPRELAVHATESNRRRLEAQLRARRIAEAKSLEEARELARLVESTVCVIAANAGESGRLFGSVTASDIADVLATKGIAIDRRRVLLDEGIRELGTYPVQIRLHPEVIATVQVEVIARDPEADENAET